MPPELKAKIRALRRELRSKTRYASVEPFSNIGPTVAAIERAFKKQLKNWRLNHSEFMVLHFLLDQGGTVTLSRMTNKLLFTRQAIALTTRALEKRGLVIREGVKNDRRKINVILTEKGFQLIKDVVLSPDRKKFHDTLVSFLAEDDLRQLASTLNRIVSGMRRKSMI